MFKVIALIVLSTSVILYIMEMGPLVVVKQGILRGKYWRTRNGKVFLGFTGTPYAKPPLGELRFQTPAPMEPWKGTLDATQDHTVCPQIDGRVEGSPIQGNEDCLFLNVYTPQISTKLLPILFYIHGGAFILGSGKPGWLGPTVLLDRNVVLITINYRLGSLGFLSTGNEWAPGNNGLKDQNLAIKWVKENIKQFGGDPNRITLFGNSAGAASVHYHMISALSRGLVNGVIIQSGAAIAPYAIISSEEAVKTAFHLGESLNCSTISSKKLVECLRKVDMHKILMEEAKYTTFTNDSRMPFRVVVEANNDGAFITEDPIESIKAGRVADIPMIIGIVTQDGAYISAGIHSDSNLLEIQNKKFTEIITETFGITSDEQNASRKLRKFYFGEKDIDTSMKNELTDLYSDGLFLWALDFTLRLHFKYLKAPIYQYLIGYRGTLSYAMLYNNSTLHDYGVCHTDEMQYLFSIHLFPNKPNYADTRMAKLLTKLWTNFAKTGNPTPNNTSPIHLKWDPVSSNDFEYFYIKGPNAISMESRLHPNRTNLWREIHIRDSLIRHVN